MEEHWFDALNKALVRHSPRRTILRAAAAVASLGLGAVPIAEAAKARKGKNRGKEKGKGKGKANRHKKDKPQGPPTSDVCDTTWPKENQEEDRKWCRKVRDEFCTQPGSGPFCIVEGDPFDEAKVATCCAEGRECCDAECVDTFDDNDHCGGCNQQCSPGKFCFGGDCVCQHGLTLCGSICRDTQRDENHCGGCNKPCSPGATCVNGSCSDTCEAPARALRAECPPDDGCGGQCAAQGLECCGDHCYDPTQAECCAAPTFGLCPKSIQHCCTTPEGINYCRTNGQQC
jgi:hypothetical protein